MLISTTAIQQPYDVIDIMMFLDTFEQKGFLGSGGYDFDGAFASSKEKMAEIARSKGGDAIIGCNFELRVAVKQGFTAQQVFELFCFGTIVKLRDSEFGN
ncbi:hypothetical protein ABIE62_000443 [Porphyrobacter sp. MBR-155]|jgi:hypothetical protein|uniref:hypothetical protein n=1 Tax=Porphyrobacter sp. MBR-155 TaxID=3156464 RepID=UPI003396C999